MIFRPLSPAELPALQTLLADCADFYQLVEQRPVAPDEAQQVWDATPPDHPRAAKSVQGAFAENGQLVGVLEYAVGYPAPEVWYIGLLLLHPQARGQQHGARWVGRFEQDAFQNGARRVRVSVADRNSAGRGFWEKNGYVVVGYKPWKPAPDQPEIAVWILDKALYPSDLQSFRLAQASDLEELERLYRACGANMLRQGFGNWGDFYPPAQTILADIGAKALWVAISAEGAILGAVALDEQEPSNYRPDLSWTNPRQRAGYVHRLAVHPLTQGQGLGQRLMHHAEETARAQGLGCIRLDSYAPNHWLRLFYTRLGYRALGEQVFLPPPWTAGFECWEKTL